MYHQPGQDQSYRWLQILIAFAVFANFAPLFVTIIGGDGTLYASISKTMALNNDYVNLYAEGRDWLDKPHFPFWVAAFFFEIFGIHGWSYKLPGILFLMMGAWYTYLFAKKLYNKETGLVAALILLTAEHILLSSNDVRAEPYLTGLIIASVYHFVCLQEKYSLRDLLLGSLFASFAVMTKGIFALLPIGGAMMGHLALTGNLRQLLQLRWLAANILTFIFVAPELYTLWLQFDQHPEKVVFGQTGVSGLKFFFWDSQFGRFFNTGPIKGKGDPSFFIHTSLWAFLPWSVLMFIAVGKRFSKFRKPGLEWYSFFAAILTFLLFSLSRFQLPHYLNVVFPFFAVITADYLLGISSAPVIGRISKLQIILVCLLFVGVIALQVLYRPTGTGWLIIGAGIIAVTLVLRTGGLPSKQRIITISSLGILIINLWLFWILYPDLLKYQSGSEAAFIANSQYPGVPVVQYKQSSYPLEFYIDAPVSKIDTLVATNSLKKPILLYVAESVDTLLVGPGFILPNFRISRLNGKFINKKRRDSQLQWSKLELIQ
ncbi:ArnT family glycosyltransferase [Flavitalea sp.]|nr:glycosyltransferase family 39 protein [Flavitalea sp.]